MSQPGMRPELRKHPAMRCDPGGSIDGIELTQQIARLRQRRHGRRIEPAQICGVDGSPATKFQSQWREVRVEDFGRRLRSERRLRSLRPKPVAVAGAQE